MGRVLIPDTTPTIVNIKLQASLPFKSRVPYCCFVQSEALAPKMFGSRENSCGGGEDARENAEI